ncbi:MAG TPA: NTP transferase domain-containing protein [Pyrinomonadaceae bacterium]|nr:NTP transferase domain-containing protein [Pyrinomonadaceae bacterium]
MKLSEIKNALAQVVADGDPDLEQSCARLSRLCTLFLSQYGDGTVSLLRAPARMGVLGEHIDYVSYLPTASLTFGSRERDALMLYRSSDGPQVRIASTSPRYEPSSFNVFEDQVPALGKTAAADWLSYLSELGTPAAHWQNYIRGAVSFARGKFGEEVKIGFEFALDSDIPPGGGASSSSALVVLGGAAIRQVNDIAFSLEELANDSGMAEWYIGTRGGSMDHITICLAQEARAVLIDYFKHGTRHVSLPDDPFHWITFFTKPADKGREIMIEYNERAAVSRLLIPALLQRWQLTDAERYDAWTSTIDALANGSLSALGEAENLLLTLPETISINTLRSDYPETLSDLERSFPALLNDTPRWPLKLRSRALHHLGEVRRVALATRTLDSIQSNSTSESRLEAMQQLGKLMDESHASLRELYGVSTSEVEQLIDIIRSHPHVMGARVMGGGFGGNVLALTTRDHSRSLIERVQKDYYDPRQRDGLREGSIIVSTPGQGLAHLDFNEVWRKAITHMSRTGTNVCSLLDVLPRQCSQEIWPVIVAAGKGTRASASGLDVPKPVALINREPAIVHVLNSIRKGLGETRPPLIIISPETEAAVREALKDEEVRFVTQQEALGTGDAVLQAYDGMRDFNGLTLVVWSTQPVIQAKTFERTAKLAEILHDYDMIVPTTLRKHPYAPIRRNELGQVQSTAETHLENAEREDFGETNIGMFLLKNQPMFEVLLDLRSRYWNESKHDYDRSRGELGFPNEVINALAKRKNGVFASAIADWREEQGVKQFEDVSTCERLIRELSTEKNL